jgi:hypothetical protein
VTVIPPIEPVIVAIEQPVVITSPPRVSHHRKPKAVTTPQKRKAEYEQYENTFHHVREETNKSPAYKRRKMDTPNRKSLYPTPKPKECVAKKDTLVHKQANTKQTRKKSKHTSKQQASPKDLPSSVTTTIPSVDRNVVNRNQSRHTTSHQSSWIDTAPSSDQRYTSSAVRIHITDNHPGMRNPTMKSIQRRPRPIYSEEEDPIPLDEYRRPFEEHLTQVRETVYRIDIRKELQKDLEQRTSQQDILTGTHGMGYNSERQADQLKERKLTGYIGSTYNEYLRTQRRL